MKIFSQIKNQKGVALMLAMFTLILISYLSVELAYETNVEFIINSQALAKVKAHYAAQSGLKISLLRLKIYDQVKNGLPAAVKSAIKPDLIDMIWRMPFTWPPTFPTELNEVDKGILQEKIKESIFDANYMTVITDEGTKIDVNNLGSISKPLREIAKKQLVTILENKIKEDEAWAKAHTDLKPEEIINNMQDWVSPGRQSINGGDKLSRFSGMGEGFPPNRAYRTIEEIRLTPGMTDDVFDVLQNHMTVFGMKGINPNSASKEIIMSLDPSITSEIADEIIKRRESQTLGGPFKQASEFWDMVKKLGAKIDAQTEQATPIICDNVYNFRIKSTGSYKNATSEIESVVMNLEKTSSQIYQNIKTESGLTSGTGSSGGQTSTNSKNNSSNQTLRIVYWNEH